MEKEILTIPKAARFCSLSRGTIWKYVKCGDLKASLTPGGQYRIHRNDLESFMREKGMYPLSKYEPEGKRILIVDDNPQAYDMFAEMVSRDGYRIEIAKDGFEAGVKTVVFKPHLIILDPFMPGMESVEVCKRIKESSNIAPIKVLAITGSDTQENRDRIMKAGADCYMPKPLKMDLLIQNVEKLLNTDSRVKNIY